MSKLKTNTIRHVDGSNDNITLDSSQNVTVENNLTVDGTSTLTGNVTCSGQAQVSSDLDIASDIRHIGDTDTKIRFPAADTVTVQTGGTERVHVDSSGNVGIGTTPETDGQAGSLYFKNGNANIWGSGNVNLYTVVNARYTGSNWKYNNTATASYVGQQSGVWNFFNAPSGTADAAATFTERFRIDSSGAVTKPSQPCSFYRTLSNSTTTVNMTNTAEYLRFTTALRDQGSDYDTSNGRFTAPVAGTYAVGSNILVDYQASTVSRSISVKKNGNHYCTLAYDHAGGAYTGMSGTGIVELAANDYINIHASQSGIHVGQESNFWCYLLG